MPEAVIVSAARSPIGRANKGSLKDFRPDDLTALITRAALDKIPELDPRTIDVTAGKEGATASVTAGSGVGRPANGAIALRIQVEPADTPIQVTPFDPPALLVAFGDNLARVAIPDLQNLLATVMRINAELAQVSAAAAAGAPPA